MSLLGQKSPMVQFKGNRVLFLWYISSHKSQSISFQKSCQCN